LDRRNRRFGSIKKEGLLQKAIWLLSSEAGDVEFILNARMEIEDEGDNLNYL
jgi:hypothetical protein